MTIEEIDYYWSVPIANLFEHLNNVATTKQEREQQQVTELTSTEANLRLSKYGKNLVEKKKKANLLLLLTSQSRAL